MKQTIAGLLYRSIYYNDVIDISCFVDMLSSNKILAYHSMIHLEILVFYRSNKGILRSIFKNSFRL